MVLSADCWKKNINELKEHSHNYIVVNTSNLLYSDDTNKLATAIDMLEFIAFVNFGNEFYEKEGINKKFDTSILFKALRSIYSGERFEEKDLKEYLNLLRNTEVFFENLSKFGSFYDQVIPSTDIELLLLGVTLEDLSEFRSLGLDGFNGLKDLYGNVSLDHMFSRIDYKDYRRKADKIIKETYKKRDQLKAE